MLHRGLWVLSHKSLNTAESPPITQQRSQRYFADHTFSRDAIVNGTSTIKVVPASVAGAVVTLSPTSFRYDGQTHSPTVTSVKLGDTTLTADTDYTVEIPTETAAGTYTVTVTGKGNYTGTAAATFTINPVETGDEFEDESGTTLRLEVETGLSTVPEALKNNAKYDTPAKIEAELRTRVEQVMSNVGENIAVFDVTLQYKDESGAWHTVDPDDFPAEGVTAILPYPAGTGATGYTFTVQHLISSGVQAGTMETLSYTFTADGLQCKFLSLSPVAIGYQAAAKPVDPVNPNPGGSSGGGGGSVSTYAVTIEKSEHGKVTSNRTNASNGSTVTLTVTPEDGYVLDTLTVTDSRGNAIKLLGMEIEVLDTDLVRALAALPADRRTIILLFYFLEMRDEEIGAELGLSRPAVQRRRTSTLDMLLLLRPKIGKQRVEEES